MCGNKGGTLVVLMSPERDVVRRSSYATFALIDMALVSPANSLLYLAVEFLFNSKGNRFWV